MPSGSPTSPAGWGCPWTGSSCPGAGAGQGTGLWSHSAGEARNLPLLSPGNREKEGGQAAAGTSDTARFFRLLLDAETNRSEVLEEVYEQENRPPGQDWAPAPVPHTNAVSRGHWAGDPIIPGCQPSSPAGDPPHLGVLGALASSVGHDSCAVRALHRDQAHAVISLRRLGCPCPRRSRWHARGAGLWKMTGMWR